MALKTVTRSIDVNFTDMDKKGYNLRLGSSAIFSTTGENGGRSFSRDVTTTILVYKTME